MMQLFCHLVGDYFLQSDWMAQNKKKRWWPAIKHGLFYTIPFLLITRHPLVLAIICVSHILIDHSELMTWVNIVKNRITGPHFMGYNVDRPAWIVVWLTIIQDNALHLMINAVAIRWASA